MKQLAYPGDATADGHGLVPCLLTGIPIAARVPPRRTDVGNADVGNPYCPAPFLRRSRSAKHTSIVPPWERLQAWDV